jgi:O-antigen ligase
VATALGALGALSVLDAEVARAAVLEAGVALSLGMFAIGVGLAAQRLGVQRLLVIPVAASLVFAFAVAVRYGAALSANASLLREHLLPAYSNYRFFNHVQTVTIPLLLAAAIVGSRHYGLRRWASAALVLEFCLLFFTGDRATMLALGVAAAVVAAAFRRTASQWLLLLGAAAVAGAGLYLLLFNAVPLLLGLPRDFFATDVIARSEVGVGGPREYLWGLAWGYIRESPLLGIGPMHYAHRINAEAAHPHNVYLQLAAEWGVPFAVLVVAIAAMGWFQLLRAAIARTDGNERALGISLAAAGVAIAVDGMFSGNFVMPMSQLWIAFAIGLALAYAHPVNASSQPIPAVAASPTARWTILALSAAGQIALWQGVWPEILDVNAHVDRVRAEIVRNVVDNPRIWSHGWVR